MAIERDASWQRQLRLTPLAGAGYLAGKGLVGMVVALSAVVLAMFGGLWVPLDALPSFFGGVRTCCPATG